MVELSRPVTCDSARFHGGLRAALRKLLKALKSNIQKRKPGRTGPLRLGRVVVSHIHIAHTTHTTHTTANTALVVLGQFGDHRVGREHQSRD